MLGPSADMQGGGGELGPLLIQISNKGSEVQSSNCSQKNDRVVTLQLKLILKR